MGYIGQAPANKVVKTADIEDSAITSAKILDGTIVNADVNASAAIAESKLTVSSFDYTDLRSDIMTLALKEAITENRVAYNLPNSMVEQFQDAFIGHFDYIQDVIDWVEEREMEDLENRGIDPNSLDLIYYIDWEACYKSKWYHTVYYDEKSGLMYWR